MNKLEEFYTLKVEVQMKINKKYVGDITAQQAEEYIQESIFDETNIIIDIDELECFSAYKVSGKLYDSTNNKLIASVKKNIKQ